VWETVVNVAILAVGDNHVIIEVLVGVKAVSLAVVCKS
jgi:hypothetical protein